ncbi:MAG: O-antigen ligase family protein [Anaerovoracaceae bacterium]|nr:O-antigen ligase family protein [Anaerovoracaceae bacterium]
MGFLQQIYMWVLNPIYRQTSKISSENRDKIVFLMMFLVYGSILVWYSINMFDIYISHTPRMLLECVILFIAILFISDKPLVKIKWNNWVAASWIICGIVILIMGFVARQNVGYWFIGPVMAFGFPCLYFVILNQKEYSRYIIIICKAIVLSSLIYFILALFADFISDTVWDVWGLRYNGTTSDANRIGEICVASFAAGIYLVTVRGISVKWQVISLAVMAFCICDAWISISRSTIIALLCMGLYYIILIFKEAMETKEIKRALVKAFCFLLCILMAYLGTFAMRSIHEYAQERARQETVVETENIAENSDAAVSEEDKDSFSAVNERLELSGKDINTFSSGRITIWHTYLSGTGILGNEADGRTPISDNLTNVAAHNTLFEFSYRSGIVAGLLFMIVEILSGIYILRVLFRRSRNNRPQDYFAAFASIGFIIVSNLQVAYNPLTSIIFFVYSLSMVVMFEYRRKTE